MESTGYNLDAQGEGGGPKLKCSVQVVEKWNVREEAWRGGEGRKKCWVDETFKGTIYITFIHKTSKSLYTTNIRR